MRQFDNKFNLTIFVRDSEFCKVSKNSTLSTILYLISGKNAKYNFDSKRCVCRNRIVLFGGSIDIYIDEEFFKNK